MKHYENHVWYDATAKKIRQTKGFKQNKQGVLWRNPPNVSEILKFSVKNHLKFLSEFLLVGGGGVRKFFGGFRGF